MSLEDARCIIKMCRQPLSLDQPVGDHEDNFFGEFLEEDRNDDPLYDTNMEMLKSRLDEFRRGQSVFNTDTDVCRSGSSINRISASGSRTVPPSCSLDSSFSVATSDQPQLNANTHHSIARPCARAVRCRRLRRVRRPP